MIGLGDRYEPGALTMKPTRCANRVNLQGVYNSGRIVKYPQHVVAPRPPPRTAQDRRRTLRQDPIDSVERLNHFARTRASYVAQTALFDYLKARMGTQFREYFMDDAFSRAIHDSSVKVFVSSLSDLTVHVVAVVSGPGRLRRSDSEAMARQCFDRGMRGGLADVDSRKIPADARSRFDRRLRETDWPEAALGNAAFALSPVDLVRHAPVIDQFKRLDRQVVATAIGHKWRDVRNTFRQRAAPDRIAADWWAASDG